MNQLYKTIEKNGKWIKDAIDILADLPPSEVLGWIYELPAIEEYVHIKKKEFKHQIVKIFGGEYEWLESGELVNFDTDFFDYYLDFKGDKISFIKYVQGKKITTAELMRYHKKLVTHAEFRHHNDQR
jgi:hypothetical protein